MEGFEADTPVFVEPKVKYHPECAVHRGFSSNREVLPLTFRHWAGVSPYTSAFALAETYVFGKQFRGLFSCGPLIKMMIELLKEFYLSDSM